MVRLFPEHARSIWVFLTELVQKMPEVTEKIHLSPNIEEALTSMRDQMDNPGHAADLIDTIARLLNQNKNYVFNGKFLANLQKAILSPSELARVKAMENKFYSCMTCGRDLHDGETVTFYNNNVVCYRCVHPTLVTCGGCNHPLPVPGVSRVITKVVKSCEHCKNGDIKKVEDIYRPQQLEDDRIFRTATTLGGAGGVQTGRIPAAPPRLRDTFEEAMRQADEDLMRRVRQTDIVAVQPRQQTNQWITMEPPQAFTTNITFTQTGTDTDGEG